VRLSVQRSDVGEFRRRYQYMVLAVFVAFVGLGVRLAQLQLIEASAHRDQARRNIVGRVTLATTRGVIRDSRGRVLAANRPSYDIYVVPAKLDLDTVWPKAVHLMGLTPSQAERIADRVRKAQQAGGRKQFQQTLAKVDVDRDVVAALETHADDLPGLDVVPTPVRYYPYGAIGAHLLGYMREIDAETLARREGEKYRAGDRLGAVGIERRWESFLRGQRGWEKVIRGVRRGARRRDLAEKYLEEPRRR